MTHRLGFGAGGGGQNGLGFWIQAANALGFSVIIEIDLFSVRVVDINLIMVWGSNVS